MSLYGIDVSDWQPNIDWSAVRGAGYDIAIFKASESVGNVQSTLDYNRDATSNWPYVGIYHFARPESNRVLIEARHFCDVVGSLRPNEFPVLDIETSSPSNWPDFIMTFCAEVEGMLGKTPVVYMSESPARSMPEHCARYPLWVAGYVSYDPVWEDWEVGPWSTPAMWQYTSSGRVPGVSGNVDCNVAPDDFALRIGLATEPQPTPTPAPIPEPIQRGDNMFTFWNDGKLYTVTLTENGWLRSQPMDEPLARAVAASKIPGYTPSDEDARYMLGLREAKA